MGLAVLLVHTLVKAACIDGETVHRSVLHHERNVNTIGDCALHLANVAVAAH